MTFLLSLFGLELWFYSASIATFTFMGVPSYFSPLQLLTAINFTGAEVAVVFQYWLPRLAGKRF